MAMNLMFQIIPMIVVFGFIFVFVMIIKSFVQAAQQRRSNDVSPVLSVNAMVSGKRADVSTYTQHTGTGMEHNHRRSSTTYYATFQVDSGDRMEFLVHANQYGMLMEGDNGVLTFQGTRYLGFERYHTLQNGNNV